MGILVCCINSNSLANELRHRLGSFPPSPLDVCAARCGGYARGGITRHSVVVYAILGNYPSPIPRLPASPYFARLVRRILPARRAIEMLVCRLGLVLQAHLRVVSHPERDDVDRELLKQVGLPTMATISSGRSADGAMFPCRSALSTQCSSNRRVASAWESPLTLSSSRLFGGRNESLSRSGEHIAPGPHPGCGAAMSVAVKLSSSMAAHRGQFATAVIAAPNENSAQLH